ncbi:hypothetical protein C8R43DRAFT_1231830 [Mycena crocata]|nr:hypothetical protein C8R43DRAFT_1231830 [Mycena crocata]
MPNLCTPSRLSACPSEILGEIIQYTEYLDYLALCRVGDWRIHAVSISFICKIVNLHSVDAVVKFCATLRSGTAFRDLVESFELKEYSSASVSHTHRAPSMLHDHDDPECAAACATAIGSLTSLSAEIAPFLRKHPSLVYIEVSGLPSQPDDNVPIEPIRLPLLQDFTGPALLATAVLPGSLTCLKFRVIAAQDPSWNRSQVFLLEVTNHRSKFRRLKMLVLEQTAWDKESEAARFEHEWELLATWHNLCPLLEDCRMPSGVRWKQPSVSGTATSAHNKLWVPDDGAVNESDLVVFKGWWESKQPTALEP